MVRAGKKSLRSKSELLSSDRLSTCLATVKRLFSFFNQTESVKLAIAPDALAVLVEKCELRATDFRCLDLGSKQIVWKMFLSLAAAKPDFLLNPRNDR